jgi:hypothetical protein
MLTSHDKLRACWLMLQRLLEFRDLFAIELRKIGVDNNSHAVFLGPQIGIDLSQPRPNALSGACSPQAWASATPFALLNAALGFDFDPGRGEIPLRSPYLPKFLEEVVLRNLRLGQFSLDVKICRHGGDVSVEVLDSRGDIELSILHSL